MSTVSTKADRRALMLREIGLGPQWHLRDATVAVEAPKSTEASEPSAITDAVSEQPVSVDGRRSAIMRMDWTPLKASVASCTHCALHARRNKTVFGVGDENADWLFVGEGPGADEDAQGLPFVGRAGKLLTQMIEAMGLQRRDVYICNVVKCRPPDNRRPEPDEVEQCSPFLLRQLDAISPKVIVCLGATAAQLLLQTDKGISQFRGQWLEFRGTKLMATYHPAYLLRNPAAKADVWKDLQKVMAELGLAVKKKPTA